MLADILNFLRKHLDEHLRVVVGGSQDDAAGERVVFVEGDKLDPLTLQIGAVSLLLINLEEERVLRNPDLHARIAEDGSRQWVQPDIRLNLYLLFVARFKKYDVAWQHLSSILEHLQSVRLFEATSTPTLPAGVERLIAELVTLSFSEHNQVFTALKIGNHPSLLYRFKLVAYRDRRASEPAEITDVQGVLRRHP